MNIGKNIKILRSKKGLTQKDLAEKLNVTPQAVSRWELDTVEPSLDTIKDMANLFGVTLDQMMSENVEETPNEVVTPQVEEKHDDIPVIGQCKICGKYIHVGEGVQHHNRTSSWYLCNECAAASKKAKEDDHLRYVKKRRIIAYSVGGALAAIVLGLFLALAICNPDKSTLGAGIGLAIALSILTFTTIFCITMKNNFIGEMWLDIASWGCVKLPGIIFSLSFNGIVFLILVKILFAILSFFLVLAALLFATGLAFLCSIFVFPVSIYWAYKRPEKTVEF